MRSDPTFWLLARSSGFTAYVLLTASGLAGLVLKSRPFGRAVKAASVLELHRFIALLALGAIALHGMTLVADRTVRMPLAGLLVPGASPYRPVAVACGVVSAEVMALVAVSFPLRRHIGQRTWRRLHWTTYVIFALATAHGLFAGSDSAQPWARDIYLGALGTLVFATAWRALYRPPRRVRAAERST
ncbi:MAG TPA: ferric reductase-like transmembrane domain-containing protein [Gaiellaceae bacterium]|nr:ferric reductase-like transmembrane domain-containing protein [Gaiellaceae bacterium]